MSEQSGSPHRQEALERFASRCEALREVLVPMGSMGVPSSVPRMPVAARDRHVAIDVGEEAAARVVREMQPVW